MNHFFVLCLSITLFSSPNHAGSLSSAGERILGGNQGVFGLEAAEIKSIASVRFSNLQGHFHICGGFIINKQWVGSAAQCLTGQTIQNTVVAVGTSTIAGGTIYSLNQIEMHPNYNELTLANDVALLRTATPITFITNVVAPAILDTEVIAANTGTTIYGWGRTTQGGNLSEKLLRQGFTTMTNDACKSKFPFVARRFIFDRNICTTGSANNYATCPGDAGGPIFSGGKIIGIVSWVEPCVAGQTNVNSRISSYANWILGFTRADD